ncbi:hypothetical protein M3Y98_00693900 [Aphelenchoides besseyi]|nr:hypothetical protein M3Y98_00693900 [Aphelenchoides besseyi]
MSIDLLLNFVLLFLAFVCLTSAQSTTNQLNVSKSDVSQIDGQLPIKIVPRGFGVGVWFCTQPPEARSSARRYIQYNCHEARLCCSKWRTCHEYEAVGGVGCNIAFGECVRSGYAQDHLCRALLIVPERAASVILMTRAQQYRQEGQMPWRVG